MRLLSNFVFVGIFCCARSKRLPLSRPGSVWERDPNFSAPVVAFVCRSSRG